MEPSPGILAGFTGHNVTPLDTIILPFSLEYENNAIRKTILLHFIIVRAASKHNIILG